jgi:beta-lactamase class A
MPRVREHIVRHVERARKRGWKPIALRFAIAFGALLLIIQIFYPGNRLLPFANVDGKALGLLTKPDATKKLNDAYAAYPVAIYMGPSDKPLVSPTLGTAKMTVDNTARINGMNYPWYLRIIPTSLFWAHSGSSPTPAPSLTKGHDEYVEKKLMPECRKEPMDASLKPANGKLELVKAVPGGQCEKDDVEKTLKSLRPNLTKPSSIRVQLKVLPPAINDKDALAKKKQVEESVGEGVVLNAMGQQISIPAKDFVTWLDFAAKDGKLVAMVSQDRSKEYIEKNVAPKVAVQPGVSKITTQDFTEISRVNGNPGQALNVPATLESLADVANGAVDAAAVAIVAIPPREEYTRTYSPTDAGISALLANYAKDHSGTFGISLIELDGKKRRADYQGDKQFVTASTYKLFVAYSVLKRIDEGKMSWEAEGTCFNKMISQSDNACAENFLSRVGLGTETREINALGLKNSNFTKEGGPFTTANDLTLLLGMIATGQNFSSTGQARLISAMKANVYRQGIPTGASGPVADKVGFMDNLLHDAAIVYSPNGTYVLAVMTEGSSWATIADLARQIDSLRAR